MVGWQVLSRPSAAEGGGRRTAFTGPAIQPYSATEVDGWQHELSRVSQNRGAVHPERREYRAQCAMVYFSGMDQATKEAFAALTQTVERGFSAVSEDIAAARDDLRSEFKRDIAGLRQEMHDGFASIREELRDIRQRLEALEEAARNSAGLTKEIDHLMERVRAIEKRLGIETKIAA